MSYDFALNDSSCSDCSFIWGGGGAVKGGTCSPWKLVAPSFYGSRSKVPIKSPQVLADNNVEEIATIWNSSNRRVAI